MQRSEAFSSRPLYRGLSHFAHAAFADGRDEFVRAEFVGGLERHNWGQGLQFSRLATHSVPLGGTHSIAVLIHAPRKSRSGKLKVWSGSSAMRKLAGLILLEFRDADLRGSQSPFFASQSLVRVFPRIPSMRDSPFIACRSSSCRFALHTASPGVLRYPPVSNRDP